MAATALTLPKFIAFDTNGDPLSGGKLYVYIAGTSTPTTSYTDSSQSTANSNPVVLDSLGSADVWLAEGSYKFQLDDSDDSTLWTVDNVSITAAVEGGDLATTDFINGTHMYAASSAGTDTYAITLPLTGSITAYAAGQTFRFKADVANTGAATLNVTNSNTSTAFGAATITRMDGSTLQDGDIAVDAIVQVVYDGTNFQLQTTAQGFTQEQVEDIVGDMVDGGTESGITVTYDDPNGKLNFDTAQTTLSLSGDATGSVTFDLANASNDVVTTVGDDTHNHTDSTLTGTEANTASTIVQRTSGKQINVSSVNETSADLTLKTTTSGDVLIAPASSQTNITGATDISGTLTVDTIADSGAGTTTISNAIDVTGSITGDSDFNVEGSTPQVVWNESDQALDNKKWRWVATENQFRCSTLDDAQTSAVNAIVVNRTGTTVDDINLQADTNITGTADVSGTLTVDTIGDSGAGVVDFTSAVTVSGATLTVDNNQQIRAEDSLGSATNLIQASAADDVIIGNSSWDDIQITGGEDVVLDPGSGAVDVYGTATGNTNLSFVRLKDSGFNSKGFIGYASASNVDVYVQNTETGGDVRLIPEATGQVTIEGDADVSGTLTVDTIADSGAGTITLDPGSNNVIMSAANIQMDNLRELQWKDSGGTLRQTIVVNGSDTMTVGNNNYGTLLLRTGGDITLDPAGNDIFVSGADVNLDNTYTYYIKDSGGTRRPFGSVDVSDELSIGHATALTMTINSSGVPVHNSIAANVFLVKNKSIYHGYVGGDGTTGNNLPPGWTATRTADPGEYRVTHNLGDSGYKVVFGSYSGAGQIPRVSATAANTFDVDVDDVAGALANGAFSFMLVFDN